MEGAQEDHGESMRGVGVFKHFGIGLMLAVGIYVGVFTVDQHLRSRRGPWEVTFTAAPAGEPMLIINQPGLGVRDVRIRVEGEKVELATNAVRFGAPEQSVPYGRVKYEDLTYLPGVVTLELFGHEIELLPRVLYVNRKARPWVSGMDVTLRVEDRPASLEEPRPKKKRY
jgi:hypothetical protein